MDPKSIWAFVTQQIFDQQVEGVAVPCMIDVRTGPMSRKKTKVDLFTFVMISWQK